MVRDKPSTPNIGFQ